VKVGDIAGTTDKNGYIVIGIDGRYYKAHHLAWFFVHRVWPVELDHKNVVPGDNSLDNLREATRSQNTCNRLMQSNNTSGFKGVSFDRQRRVFHAYIKLNGKRRYLGCRDTALAASFVYERAAIELHGEFANTAKVA
jgi:hypothetical protein